jgi:hypothetical protein
VPSRIRAATLQVSDKFKSTYYFYTEHCHKLNFFVISVSTLGEILRNLVEIVQYLSRFLKISPYVETEMTKAQIVKVYIYFLRYWK